MLITEQIAKLIEEMIETGGGEAHIKRNDLAQSLGCVPSQVSYVISSRFTPAMGYRVESRRGGGGFIRIVKVRMTKNQYLEHILSLVGDSLDMQGAGECVRAMLKLSIITEREGLIILNAVSDSALRMIVGEAGRNAVRADIIRQIIMFAMQ